MSSGGMRYVTIGGKPALHPGQLYGFSMRSNGPMDYWQRANSYACPRGATPGVAWVLLDRADADDLDDAEYHTLVFSDQGYDLAIPHLSIVKASTMFGALPSDKTAPRLVKFEDKRRQLAMSDVNAQYNVRHPAPASTSGATLYYDDSLNSGSVWTWQTLLNDLWGNLPSDLRGTAPTLPYSPDGDPEGWRFVGCNAWEAIHRVLAKVQCTTAYDPTDGTFTYVQLGTVQSGLASFKSFHEGRRMYDFDADQQHGLGLLPETVRVYFRRRELYHGIEKDTPDSGNWEMSPVVSKDYTTNVSGAQAGTVKVIHDDLPALYNAAGTNTNAADLQTRADEIGDNWVNRILESHTPQRVVFDGAVDSVTPGSQVREVIWSFYDDQPGMITEWIQGADPQPTEPNATASGKAPERLLVSIPDYPHYPRTDQWVQVDDGSSPTGTDLSPNGDGLFPGYVIRWTGSAYEQQEACWIQPGDLSGTDEAAVQDMKQKDRCFGRLYGNQTSGGTTLPKYHVRKGTPGEEATSDVKFVEVTAADGTIYTDCHTSTTRQTSDCVFRARIITQDPNTQNLCTRTDVTDGADIWLKIAHGPWCNDLTKIIEGQRFLARKITDSYEIGETDLPCYETFMEDSRLWSLKPSANWSAPPYAHDEWLIDNSGAADFTANPIDDPWGLWDNVLSEDTLPGGYGIMMGDEIYPIAMRRRAFRYTANVNDGTGISPQQTSIIVDGRQVISESPFTKEVTFAAVNNPYRLSCLDNTEVAVERDANYGTGYVAVAVARSEPILIELAGSPDGQGLETELDGTTPLAVWDARITTHNPATPGNMNDGNTTAVNQESIWFAHVGMDIGTNGSMDPYYLPKGQRMLAYDIGKDFTPTGGAARRLYVCPRDSETFFGKAKQNWTQNSTSGVPDSVVVYPCTDGEGGTSTTNVEHTVLLLQHAEKDPNVVQDDVIAYRLAASGEWVCVSSYLDDKIGTVKMWALSSAAIPPGWAIMNGSANSVANGGSEINMTNRFVKAAATAGTRDGKDTHTHWVFVTVEPHSLESTMHHHETSLVIYPHTIEDLDHSHNIPSGTIQQVGLESLQVPPLAAENPCTKGPPHAGSSVDGYTDCPSGDWGPLHHTYEFDVAPASIGGGELEHFAAAMATEESNEPPHTTLIFIERINNSV